MPVKKRILLPLVLLMMTTPAAAGAEELPQLFAAVKDGATEGMMEGAVMAYAGMAEELTLALAPENMRLEEGKTLQLTITAGNPRPQDTNVTFTLKLPERLQAAQELVWDAVLPAAQTDSQSGALVPSVTTFTRDIALMAGGVSEETTLVAEMNMGTRFYRASAPLALCVADVKATAAIEGAENGRMYPGDHYAYTVEITNNGTAPKDVPLELALPACVTPSEPLPQGFVFQNGVIRGQVRAEAAAPAMTGLVPFSTDVRFPIVIDENALENDEDALRLLSGALRVDAQRVALPRAEVCGAKIHAQLLSEKDSLKEGEAASLRVVVVNSGLAPADVRLSCVLPQGLKLAGEEQEATPDEAIAASDPEDGARGAGAGVPAEENRLKPVMAEENRTLIFNLHMDAAKETSSGITAATKVIELDVVADTAKEQIREQLVGAALAWTVDEGETNLGDAVAMRVYKPSFMGIVKEDWNGLFWASMLLLVTISLLYAAVKSDDKEDFCCE